jgi:hypothetical protein
MQFAAQQRHYQEHYADASFRVILRDGVPAGRLYVARWPTEIRIVDIALLPQYRNRGSGHGGVPQRGLHEVDGGVPVLRGVRRVGVAQPVRRHPTLPHREPDSGGGGLDEAPGLGLVQRPAAPAPASW